MNRYRQLLLFSIGGSLKPEISHLTSNSPTSRIDLRFSGVLLARKNSTIEYKQSRVHELPFSSTVTTEDILNSVRNEFMGICRKSGT